MTSAAVDMRDVDLSLGSGAAQVHILRKRQPDNRARRGGRPGRALGLRQIDAADGDGRPRAARQRRNLHRRRADPPHERGRARPLPRRAHRHRVPVVPAHPDHDGAGKRRRAAGTRRRPRRARSARATNSPRSASPTGSAIIPRSFRAASSSAWRSPARLRRNRRCSSPTSRPATSTRRPGAAHFRTPVRAAARARRDARVGHARPRARGAVRPRCAHPLRHDRAGEPGGLSGMRLAALLRFAGRDLRGGFEGLRIFLACIAIGVAAIVGVNSLARSLEDGLAREGRKLLGGDASFSRHPPRAERRKSAPFSPRTASSPTSPTMRAMASNAAGDATLADVKAVGPDWPPLGDVRIRSAASPTPRRSAGAAGATAPRSTTSCSTGWR